MPIDPENKVICAFPWIHTHITPRGNIYPCCNTGYTNNDYGIYSNEKLIDIMNSSKMKELRYNMMNNIPSEVCTYCYEQEKVSVNSGRTYSLEMFKDELQDLVDMTYADGELDEFKMKYFDIRFSNICNMKCRTCGPEFSSQWSKEVNAIDKRWPIVFHANNQQPTLLNEVLDQLENIKVFYFAGGEPLITDEHYIILEELLKRDLADSVELRYNTNLSSLRYKDKDTLDLWKWFNTIKISASIDHYGERAEYIRHGTNWGNIENNLLIIKKLPNIVMSVNTVLSIFNYPTLDNFYFYLMEKGLYTPPGRGWSLHKAFNPKWYMAQILPREIKDKVAPNIKKLIEKKNEMQFASTYIVQEALDFVESQDKWAECKNMFLENVKQSDQTRSESFTKIFPELESMYE